MKGQIPDSWNGKIKTWWSEFIDQTEYQEYQPYSNGFIGVGILKKLEDHGEGKRVNQIVFMWYLTFESVPDSVNRVAVTEDEAKSLLKNLQALLQQLDKEKKK